MISSDEKNTSCFWHTPRSYKNGSFVHEFKMYPDFFETKVCVTAQHREMLDQVLDFFDITADYDLDLMKPGQNLYNLTTTI